MLPGLHKMSEISWGAFKNMVNKITFQDVVFFLILMLQIWGVDDREDCIQEM